MIIFTEQRLRVAKFLLRYRKIWHVSATVALEADVDINTAGKFLAELADARVVTRHPSAGTKNIPYRVTDVEKLQTIIATWHDRPTKTKAKPRHIYEIDVAKLERRIADLETRLSKGAQ